MDEHRIVLDTNVIVSALRSRRGPAFRLLSLVGTGRFEICLSVPMLFEYEDVLGRAELGIPSEAAEDVLNYLCFVAVPQEIFFLWRPYLRDPRDDLVLELAVGSRSAAIITYNIKDFAGIENFNVRAMRPADFLIELGVKP